ASSVADISSISLTLDGQPVALDSQGRAAVVAGVSGRMLLEATATDADGLVGHASSVLKVRDPSDKAAPVVSFDPLLKGAQLASATAIMGTVADTNLDSWVLEEAPLNFGSFTQLAAGNVPVAAATLAVFDP